MASVARQRAREQHPPAGRVDQVADVGGQAVEDALDLSVIAAELDSAAVEEVLLNNRLTSAREYFGRRTSGVVGGRGQAHVSWEGVYERRSRRMSEVG